MRHFRSFRGSRRGNGVRPMVRTAKYIVVTAAASEASGTNAVTFMKGKDDTTLGQTSVTDNNVPVGARITKVEMFMPKVNLTATANFVTWSITRSLSGQAVINPVVAGGDPLRKNILLTGVVGLGDGQNNSLHVKWKVPRRFQRVGDGDLWIVVNNNESAVSTFYYFIYTVQM